MLHRVNMTVFLIDTSISLHTPAPCTQVQKGRHILGNLKSTVLNNFHKFPFWEEAGFLGNLKSKVLNNSYRFSFVGDILGNLRPKLPKSSMRSSNLWGILGNLRPKLHKSSMRSSNFGRGWVFFASSD